MGVINIKIDGITVGHYKIGEDYAPEYVYDPHNHTTLTVHTTFSDYYVDVSLETWEKMFDWSEVEPVADNPRSKDWGFGEVKVISTKETEDKTTYVFKTDFLKGVMLPDFKAVIKPGV